MNQRMTPISQILERLSSYPTTELLFMVICNKYDVLQALSQEEVQRKIKNYYI
jgi:signal recognition particle receptor subunit beta